MQIDPTQFSRVQPPGVEPVQGARVEATEAAPAEATAGAGQVDRMELSQRAQEVQAAHQTLAVTPEVRAELVDRLRAEIQAGTYKVDPDRIAEAMIPDA